MKGLIEPLMAAAAAVALMAIPSQDDDGAVCEHDGRGPTTPANLESARKLLASLERSWKEAAEVVRPPAPPALPRCAGRDTRRTPWPQMPKALEDRVLRIESSDGVSAELIRELRIRCVPTEVRFLAGGEIEWVEGRE